MEMPTKFTGMTDDEIGAYLNVDNNIESLISSEISWLLLNKQPIVDLVDFDHLDNFNEKLSTTDFTADLTQSQIISIVNDPSLTGIEKTGVVTEVEEYLSGNISVSSSKKIKLQVSVIAASVSNSASGAGGASALLANANYINEIIGIVTVIDLISNVVPTSTTITSSFSQNLNTIFSGFYSSIKNMTTGAQGIPSDLTGSTDPGFGFTNSVGGTNSTGTFFGYGGAQVPADSKNTASTTSTGTTGDTTAYKRLDDVLTRTISQDWRAKNSKPGNPLILEAYAISGRNYDRDGTSGEYAWSAAYVNWVLNKSGLEYMKVMSPAAYAGYGSPVDFGTFKKVRKNDLIIMTSVHGIGHIGFVRAYDPKTNLVTVLGGNQSGMVKLTKIELSRSNPNLYISHIRRNWEIPSDKDVPLFQTSTPTRPGQQRSGAASVRDLMSGINGAASGGTLI